MESNESVKPDGHHMPAVKATIIKLLLSLPAIIFIFSGCNEGVGTDENAVEQTNAQIEDSISEGNYRWARERIGREITESLLEGDSSRWANAVTRRAVLAYYSMDPDTLLIMSNKAVAWLSRHAESQIDIENYQKALQTTGAYYAQFRFNGDSSIKYHRMATDICQRLDNLKVRAQAFGNLADTYKNAGHYPEASACYHRAILIADSAGFTPYEYLSLYSGLASVYTTLEDFESSRVWWDKVIQLRPYMTNYDRFTVLNNLGNDYFLRGDYRTALSTFKGIMVHLDSVGGGDWEKNFIRANLADTYLHLGMTDSAKAMLDIALPYFENVAPTPTAQSYLHTIQISYYQKRGNYARVEELNELHPLSDTIRPEQQIFRLKAMSDYYRNTGQPELAIETIDKINTLKDSLMSQKIAGQVAEKSLLFDRDRNILELRSENAEKQRDIYKLWVTVSSVLLGALAVIIFLISRNRLSKKREQRILDKMISLRMENIRNRITPHFIYNALNHELLALRDGKPSRLKSITSLLRHQQVMAQEMTTSLNREVEFLEYYVSVAETSVNGEFIFRKEIDAGIDLESIRVPSMILQILAENAFKHAFPHITEGTPKILSLKITDTETECRIRLYNNCPGRDTFMSTKVDRVGQGMRIIMESIKILNMKKKGEMSLITGKITKPGEEGWESVIIIKK